MGMNIEIWISWSPKWVQKCIEYARLKGYNLGDRRNLHLENKRIGEFEIFNLSYFDTDGYIICYPNLFVNGDQIETSIESKRIKSFSEFKKYLDQIIEDYKKLQIEIKIKEVERDFE